MSGHAGSGMHYHGTGSRRYGHSHPFLHINHEHDERPDAVYHGVCANLEKYGACSCSTGVLGGQCRVHGRFGCCATHGQPRSEEDPS